jgi:hypothetical protein
MVPATSSSRAWPQLCAGGLDETLVVTRSNKRANIYNQGIRNMVLDREDQLCAGDMLMVVRNNYSVAALAAAIAERSGWERGATLHLLGQWRPCPRAACPQLQGAIWLPLCRRVATVPRLRRLRGTDHPYHGLADHRAPALTREQNEQLYGRSWKTMPTSPPRPSG